MSQGVKRQLFSVFVLNLLDYCNAVLYGLPRSTISALQRVQNAAARLVLSLNGRVNSALRTLHGVDIGSPFINHGILFKIALAIMYTALTGQCPEYIKDSVPPVASGRFDSYTICRQIQLHRSTLVTRSRTEFGGPTFSIAGAEVWNLWCVSHNGPKNNQYTMIQYSPLEGDPGSIIGHRAADND